MEGNELSDIDGAREQSEVRSGSENPRLRAIAEQWNDNNNKEKQRKNSKDETMTSGPITRSPSKHSDDEEIGLDHKMMGMGKSNSGVPSASSKETMFLAVKALGVIYGDIGTSPLYTVSSILTEQPDTDATLGAISLIVWALFIVVCIKYVVMILRVDHHGEGGIFALSSLLSTSETIPPKLKQAAIFLALFGSAFVIGDGVITPAISVLSAVAGLDVKAPNVTNYVMPITLVILFFLFIAQSRGTGKIGASFGPIMFLWFFSIAAIGLYNISLAPLILASFSPHYGIVFLAKQGTNGFLLLGSVVLCVTGVEALYADLGHFGRLPIRLSWLGIAFPCLLLAYLGQGAAILANPSLYSNIFFSSVPSSLQWPMIILSTLATIIASQAMITGSFSLIHQAMNFQYFPRVKIQHTSDRLAGQIYIPELNFILMVLCLACTAGFQNSNALAGAYGVAVTGVMTFTSVLYMLVCYYVWHTKLIWIILYGCTIFMIDVFFFTANLTKIPEGGWFSLTIGIVFAVVMIIWKEGKVGIAKSLGTMVIPIEHSNSLMRRYALLRPRGVAVFLHSIHGTTPISYVKLLSRQRALPSVTLFVNIHTVETPFVMETVRYQVSELGDGIVSVIANYGYMEVADAVDIVSHVLKDHLIDASSSEPHEKTEGSSDSNETHTITFYLSQEKISADSNRWIGHRIWVGLFRFLHKNARNAASLFKIPAEDSIEVGTKVVL